MITHELGVTLDSTVQYGVGINQGGEEIEGQGDAGWNYVKAKIANPIEEHLNTTYYNGQLLKDIIRYIVLCKGIPHRIDDTNVGDQDDLSRKDVSVDALLSLLNQGNGTDFLSLYGTPEPLARNPYFKVDNKFTMDYRFISNHFEKDGWKLQYLVSRLDGDNYQDVIDLIDRSLDPDLTGEKYWIIDESPGDHIFDEVRENIELLDFNFLYDNTSTWLFETPNNEEVIGYVSWGVHSSIPMPEDYILNTLLFSYAKGAIFNSMESYNGSSFGYQRPNQGLVSDFIHMAGTGGGGNVWEPQVLGVYRSEISFPVYALGYNLVDAIWMGYNFSGYRNVVVGDPLTRIYDCPEQVLTGTLNSGTYLCRIIIPEGGVLTIPAGAIINFERNGSLRVEGNLIVESNSVNFNTYSELRVLDTGVLTANTGTNITFSEKSRFNVNGIANLNDNTAVTFNDDTEFNINKNLYASGSTLSFNDNSSFEIYLKMKATNSIFNFETNSKIFYFHNKDTLLIDNCTIEKGNLNAIVDNLNDIGFVRVVNSTFNDNKTPIKIDTRLNQDLTVIVENNIFNNPVQYSINAIGIKNITITGNEINGNQIITSSDGIHLENNGEVVIDSNTINYTVTGIKTIERVLDAPELGVNQTLLLKDNLIEYSGTGIQLSDPSNYISIGELKSNIINNCEDGIILNNISSFSPGLKGNFIANSTNQGIAVTNVAEITVQNNSVTNSALGINLSNVTNAHIIDNTIISGLNSMPGIFIESSNGELRGNTISGHTNGIVLGNSSPDIGDNTITDNLYHGIYIGSGSLPNMVGTFAGSPPLQYPTAGYNDIFENGGCGDPNLPPDNDGSEIFISFANARMDKGCNSIVDDRAPGGNLINTKYLMGGESFGMPIRVNAEYNYWSINPLYQLEERFNNLIVNYANYYIEPCTLPQGASGGGNELFVTTSNGAVIDTLYSIDIEIGELSTTELLYAVAEEKFLTADYENAETVYNQIINSNDSLNAKLKAYQRLYNIGRLTHKSPNYFSDLKTVYSSLSQSSTDSLHQKIFSQLASLSLVGQTEYVSAIEEFDAVVQQNQGTEEAMYAEIDALTTALLLAPDSSLGKGSLGKYAVTDISDYTNRVSNLLKQRVGSSNYIKEPIPTEYALYQNYPNPFNPSTTIKYSIVKTGKVKLAVYDILGREVIVLADEVKEPGFYEVNFNSSNLSSGVYFYRIISGSFVSTRKMVLVK